MCVDSGAKAKTQATNILHSTNFARFDKNVAHEICPLKNKIIFWHEHKSAFLFI